MKKIVSVFLSILLAFSCFAITAAADTVIYGDVDGDKKVTAADARIVLRFSVKLEELTARQQLAADVDKDNHINASDARTILRGAVNLDWPGDFGKNGSEIFNAGTYDMTMSVTGSDTTFTVVNAENCSYMELTVDFAQAFDKPEAKPVNMGILTQGENSYMVIPESKYYLRLDADTTGGGFDMSEILDMFDLLGAQHGSNNTRPDDKATITENGKEYTALTYNSTESAGKTVHLLSGNILKFIRTYDEEGTLVMEMVVESITSRIPAEVSTIPADATILSGEAGMMAFMLNLVALSGMSISDLQ